MDDGQGSRDYGRAELGVADALQGGGVPLDGKWILLDGGVACADHSVICDECHDQRENWPHDSLRSYGDGYRVRLHYPVARVIGNGSRYLDSILAGLDHLAHSADATLLFCGFSRL